MEKNEAFQKMARYCAYQERCSFEVNDKLSALGCSPELIEEVIEELQENNFLDDMRFALTFAESKFRLKRWGKVKIRHHLEHKGITELQIIKALNQIDEREYLEVFYTLIDEKKRKLNESNEYTLNYKIGQFLISRGFEGDLIWEHLRVKN